MTGLQTFPKKEKLYGVKGISALLSKGKYGNEGLLRFCYRPHGESGEDTASRLVVSVSKRLFKRAVKRNLLKRRIRESYRRQKNILVLSPVDIMIIYNNKEIATYEEIYAAVGRVLERVSASRQLSQDDGKKR